MPDAARIIERIYEAVAEPGALGALAGSVAHEFGCESSFLYTVESSRERRRAVNKDLLSATDNFDEWAHVSYTNYYLERDEWARLLFERSFPSVATGADLTTTSEFGNSEIYTDYFRKIGVYHAMGGFFPVRGSEFGVVAIHRPRAGGEFGAYERRLMLQLVPHFQRVYQIHQRLTAAEKGQSLTIEVIERLSLGAVIVDGNARVVLANELARRHLQRGSGLTTMRGCLRAQLADENASLQRNIHAAALTSAGAGSAAGGLVSISRAAGPPLSVLISPFRKAVGYRPEHQAALVLISDPATRPEIPEHVLAKSLKLTLAEARLLAALVAGRTMSDYADAAQVTMNTAKTQLRQIFFKTGYNRQADLIRAVMADPLVAIQSKENDAVSSSGSAYIRSAAVHTPR